MYQVALLLKPNFNDVTKDEIPHDEKDASEDSQQDVNALLANALNLVTDNDIVRDYIANAINAAAE